MLMFNTFEVYKYNDIQLTEKGDHLESGRTATPNCTKTMIRRAN